VPGSLRAQLAIAIGLVTALGVGLSFLALYNGTGARLDAQIDTDLKTQVSEWDQVAARAHLSPPAALERTARQFIAAQRYHAASRILVVRVSGGSTVNNDSTILEREAERERGAHARPGLLDAPAGLATVLVSEAGDMRVLTHPIYYRGQQVGVLRVADPLTQVRQAQSDLLRTFAVVGLITLALAVAAGVGIANLIAAPLRRMARVAAAVDGGDLSMRAGPVAARGEVRTFSETFDRMLERLELAFQRERDFVSDASHELRTPLAVLRAQVELLDRETDEPRRHAATATLLQRLDELDRLVGEMLTLASAEAGQLIDPGPIELTDFFEDVRRDLPLFGERDFRLEAVGGTLNADPNRLTQVLRNLVRNAVAHTEPGDRIVLSARARDGRLEITVSDSGRGIPPDQLEHIFERFYRADASRPRDSGGSGLGLAIARAIVEAHGGRIRAESSPGKGATFGIELPGYEP
jgi:two-component system, OmpR family, sensor kinase